MTQSDIGIVEKLKRCTYTLGPKGKESPRPINPDGPEAAAIIMEMVEALGDARNQLQHVNHCHIHLDSTDSLLAKIDTALAKVRSK